MNYYIQGDAANAEEIKAAFKKLGYNTGNLEFTSSLLYYTIEGKVELMCPKSLQNLIKTHPDYKELELHVEPKFKIGDWIVRVEGFVYEPSLITEIRDYYICELLNGERVTYTLNDVHKNFHLWTIADAKDGDVLATGNIICIFKKLDKDGYYIISPCIYTVKDGLEVIDDEDDTIGSCGFKPATKEDRELLFRKMKEAGYEWDADKKELRKIQPHYDIKNFKPFDKVLVRDEDDGKWMAAFYSPMTIIINDCNGHYTKTWHNWDRNIVPQVGDILLFHFGDDNEITQQATVIARVFDGTRPDIVYLTTDYKKGGEDGRD